ncbi:hypothetical protein UFOVP49_199 [uncultured Caudovirales phage]|uniref:Uncharacterized protein n=1 Tax=uncultured Caudovirales phage TaxID=2100421 RepID=A0A6J5KR59_9CAUD|nr:hypothetical protein UFOVP49_199 [uncultured Caudovirales phage]
MSVNNPEVQIISDSGKTTLVKITGYYNTATVANVKAITANALAYGNTSQTCLVSITKMQFACDSSNGTVQLFWADTSANTPIANFGSSQTGTWETYLTNNAPNPTGDIGIQTIAVGNGDSYTFLLTLNKEQGYANAWARYNNPEA